ncbi:hypothetical protein [Tunturiibacter lichenicola]|uniref:hypothetical protein n=1 Tax=Tunturiibacter lichenicola TaxID=2051959 RepID=UPI003D9B569F
MAILRRTAMISLSLVIATSPIYANNRQENKNLLCHMRLEVSDSGNYLDLQKGDDAVRTLDRMKLGRGRPKVPFCDNASVFTSQAVVLGTYRS